MHGEDRHPHSAFSAPSLVSASSNSSGTSGNSISGQSSSLAVATAGQKMDSELRCPACRRYFYCPLLLPCGHSLCTSCAAAGLLPATEPHVAAAIQAALTLPTTDQYNTAAGASFSSASSTTGSSSGCSSQPFGQNQSQPSHIPNSAIHHVSSAHSDSDQVAVCTECLESDSNLPSESHGKHEVQPLNSACKSKKTHPSQEEHVSAFP
ncbi:hypothetical protein X801_02503 [Opisthorchis viverrini]|uniref:Zinc finger C3HC4 RING-type domain-containing protein n=1 Tax=Opisthorchis viverrini TaxID=6198 RepID=A0A1S8X4I7_OPIVI|nr:hypothetical protein X801_02503 [Opisthorchis viverrini]